MTGAVHPEAERAQDRAGYGAIVRDSVTAGTTCRAVVMLATDATLLAPFLECRQRV
jgi:hypothetical protein